MRARRRSAGCRSRRPVDLPSWAESLCVRRSAVNSQSRPSRTLLNKTPHVVLKRGRSAPAGAARRSDDRRVRRTRQALVQALVSLVVEKRYDAITVRELLDRADVARSTFYSHYRGKDDLLLKSFERMLSMLDQHLDRTGDATRVVPVRELFHHVGKFRSFHQALVRARVMDRQYQGRTGHLSHLIERRLTARLAGSTAAAVPPPVLAQGMAGALFAL